MKSMKNLLVIFTLFGLSGVSQASTPDVGSSPPRQDVKEVKYHAGVNAALKRIEEEACRHYESNPTKIWYQVRNTKPGDVIVKNFGYSCPKPGNPRGGWLYSPEIESQIDRLAAVSMKAKEQGVTDPDAGKIIADEVYVGSEFYRKDIFPDVLPDDTTPDYTYWKYSGLNNPLRMEIYIIREGNHSCPAGTVLGNLSGGEKVCWQRPNKEANREELIWHDHTVFENYPRRQKEETWVSYGEHTAAIVTAPDPAKVTPAKVTTDTWKYRR